MSLATAGGGGLGGAGGGAGMAMAHSAGPSAMQIHQSHAQPPPGSHSHAGHHHTTTAPPVSLASLGADQLDKNQNLSLKQLKSVSKLPIVSVDLYGSGEVAYYPPLVDKESETYTTGGMSKGMKVKSMGTLFGGTSGTDVTLKQNSDVGYKAVRRLLSKGFGYNGVLNDAIAEKEDEDPKKKKDGGKVDVVKIVRPYLLLGARNTSTLHEGTMKQYTVAKDDSAISEEDEAGSGSSVLVRNGTMDGSPVPQNDDYDRVVFSVKLHDAKKPLTMLPEEAVSVLLAKGKNLVSLDASYKGTLEEEEEEEEEVYADYPTAFAVPGWACHDTTIESLLDAAGPNGGVVYQRPLAALAGALLPRLDTQNRIQKGHKLLFAIKEIIETNMQQRQKAAQRAGIEEVDMYKPVVLLAGMTLDGLEVTAVEIGNQQAQDPHCLFGDLKVLSTVSYQHHDPMSLLEKAMGELRTNVNTTAPESEIPIGFVTYGKVTDQIAVKTSIMKILKKYTETEKDVKGDDHDGWDDKMAMFSTREECVALGTAVLGAVSHGRIRIHVQPEEGSSKKKYRTKMGIVVQNVSSCAVGIQFNYHGGADKKDKHWTPIKTIFDFDRRVPAGPYPIELSAAECAAHMSSNSEQLEEEKILDAAKKFDGSKMIPKREEAALKLRVKVLQKYQRHDDWVQVGDVMSPLCMDDPEDDEGAAKEEKDREKIACESAIMELSLGSTGLITSSLIGDGKSVVQATKAARNSKIQYYLGILAAILFFGGFLVKSYVEEHVFDRDTARLLAYYKHVVPNTMHDGDERGARYLIWKYKGKKDKLWRRLEVKYGVPVRHAHEWDDDDDVEKEEKEGEMVEDLDENDKYGEENEEAKTAGEETNEDDGDDGGEQDL